MPQHQKGTPFGVPFLVPLTGIVMHFVPVGQNQGPAPSSRRRRRSFAPH